MNRNPDHGTIALLMAEKMKLCWNCEGKVSLEEENCPYCGVYLGPVLDEQESHGLPPPPYKIVDGSESEESSEEASSPDSEALFPPQPQAPLDGQAISDVKGTVVPLLFLSAGSVFLLFGLALFLFSSEGRFALEWDGRYWYAYLALALPLLLFGWYTLQKSDDESSGA